MNNGSRAGTLPDSWSFAPSRAYLRVLRFYPSLTDFAFAIPAFLLLVILPHGASNLLADADTGWHIRTGEWILRHRAVPTVDFFSFTKPGQAWFAWEWGWDVMAGLIHQFTGLAGLVFVNLAILCLVSALLFRLVRKICNHDVLALLTTILAMLVSMMHWLARPHLLSWVFFLLLLHVLWDAESGSPRRLLCLPLLILVWTNVHGSFFIGVGMIAISAAGVAAARGWRRSLPFWISAATCAAATFVNPYTWRVHQHIIRYLTDGALMDKIQEFQSINFHHFPAALLEIFLLPVGAIAVWCFLKRHISAGLMVLLWAHLALLAARNVPLFAFIASPFIAACLVDLVVRLEQMPKWRRFASALLGIQARLAPSERVHRVYAPSAVLLLFCGACFAAAQTHSAPESAFQARFPASFPSQVVPVVQKYGPARIFTTDQWGDFFLYHFSPSVTVFVDGRSDFYGPKFLGRCHNILEARWDWEQDLLRFAADMVIVPPDTPVATVLKASPHWTLLFDDGSAVVFGRAHASGAQTATISSVVRNGGRKLGAATAYRHKT